MSGPRPVVAMGGNPNVGKTTLFNVLTGSRARVGNYPGVTVEKRGRGRRARTRRRGGGGRAGDLLAGRATGEEEIALAALLGLDGEPRPDVVVLASTPPSWSATCTS